MASSLTSLPTVSYQIQVKHPSKGMLTQTFSCTAETTIRDLHLWIQEKEGIPIDQQRFFVLSSKTFASATKVELSTELDKKIGEYIESARYLELSLK